MLHQTNRKRDGETFLNMFAVGLVLLDVSWW